MCANVSDDQERLRQDVINKVVGEEEVQFYWTILSQQPEEAHERLEDVVTLLVTVWGYSLTAL